MPWLLLNMEMEREIDEVPQPDGSYKLEPTGPQSHKILAIDTDKGQVTEVSYQITGGKLKERPPTSDEIATATKLLGKDKPSGHREIQKLESRLRNAKAEAATARTAGEAAQREVQRLRRELQQAKRRTPTNSSPIQDPPLPRQSMDSTGFTQDQANLLGAALDGYIDRLYASDQFDSYHDARKLYKLLTGVDHEMIEDDDEEDILNETTS